MCMRWWGVYEHVPTQSYKYLQNVLSLSAFSCNILNLPGKDEGMDYCEKPFFRSALWAWASLSAVTVICLWPALIHSHWQVPWPYQSLEQLGMLGDVGRCWELFWEAGHYLGSYMEELRAHREASCGERQPVYWVPQKQRIADLCPGKVVRLKGATVDYADYQGRTPLHEARHGHVFRIRNFFIPFHFPCAKVYERCIVDTTCWQSFMNIGGEGMGRMGTVQAAYYGHQNLVEFLLDKAGAHREGNLGYLGWVHGTKRYPLFSQVLQL